MPGLCVEALHPNRGTRVTIVITRNSIENWKHTGFLKRVSLLKQANNSCIPH